MRTILAFVFSAAVVFSAAALPSVSGVKMDVGRGGQVITVSYNLSDGPAIVTMKWLTNGVAVGTSSLGATGAVERVVQTGNGKRIVWRPKKDWADAGNGISLPGLQVELTAWALDNPPDYMVADISDGATAADVRYYVSVDALPGGLLGNSDYWETKVVFRRVPAAGRPFVRGTAHDGEPVTPTTLTNDFYLAVFETTRGQWRTITGKSAAEFAVGELADRRPATGTSRIAVRGDAAVDAAPSSESYLDTVRTRTGIAVDLPTEAEWEFACNAGLARGFWGDGSRVEYRISTVSDTIPGRYRYNGGWQIIDNGDGTATTNTTSSTAEYGTAPAATYNANLFGIYDMHGNVTELCLDAYDATSYVVKGGSWNAYSYSCEAYGRGALAPDAAQYYYGFRMRAPIPSAVTGQ